MIEFVVILDLDGGGEVFKVVCIRPVVKDLSSLEYPEDNQATGNHQSDVDTEKTKDELGYDAIARDGSVKDSGWQTAQRRVRRRRVHDQVLQTLQIHPENCRWGVEGVEAEECA